MQKAIGIIGGLLVFAGIALVPLDPVTVPFPAQLTAAVTGLMVIWWVTEAIPIYATALAPLVLFPLLGVLSPVQAAVSYGNETVFLFMGGFFIAAAMVRWNLHRRIALNVISLAGSGTKKLVLGFMAATAFLSMWISNTATAMMMIPIALALVSSLMPGVMTAKNGEQGGQRQFATCLLLGVCYAATIGGMATLIGTPPNAILVAQTSGIFPDAPGIDFFSWMTFAVPFMAIFLLIAWYWLTSVTNRNMPEVIPGSRDMIGHELKKLGPLTPAEKWTLMVFLSVALLWISRTPKVIGSLVIPGITTYIPGVTDATIAIGGALILFMLPADAKSGTFTLDWQAAKEIPWGSLSCSGEASVSPRGSLKAVLPSSSPVHLSSLPCFRSW